MTTDNMMALQALMAKNSDADVLREMIEFAAEGLMALEVEDLVGAGQGECSPDRINQRNGYRARSVHRSPVASRPRTPRADAFHGLEPGCLGLVAPRRIHFEIHPALRRRGTALAADHVCSPDQAPPLRTYGACRPDPRTTPMFGHPLVASPGIVITPRGAGPACDGHDPVRQRTPPGRAPSPGRRRRRTSRFPVGWRDAAAGQKIVMEFAAVGSNQSPVRGCADLANTRPARSKARSMLSPKPR